MNKVGGLVFAGKHGLYLVEDGNMITILGSVSSFSAGTEKQDN